MLDLILVILFSWLFFKACGLAFRVAWGLTKFIASLLLVLACPLLVISMIFFGGFVLLLPVAIIALAFGLLKACVC